MFRHYLVSILLFFFVFKPPMLAQEMDSICSKQEFLENDFKIGISFGFGFNFTIGSKLNLLQNGRISLVNLHTVYNQYSLKVQHTNFTNYYNNTIDSTFEGDLLFGSLNEFGLGYNLLRNNRFFIIPELSIGIKSFAILDSSFNNVSYSNNSVYYAIGIDLGFELITFKYRPISSKVHNFSVKNIETRVYSTTKLIPNYGTDSVFIFNPILYCSLNLAVYLN